MILSASGNVILWLAACGNSIPRSGILYLGIQSGLQIFLKETLKCSHGVCQIFINCESHEEH